MTILRQPVADVHVTRIPNIDTENLELRLNRSFRYSKILSMLIGPNNALETRRIIPL